MKVRFRNPERNASLSQEGTGMAPARRPSVPGWRWYLLVMLVASLFLIVVARFLFELLGLKGSGYLIYQARDLVAPAALEVQQLLVRDGGEVRAGSPLVQGRLQGQPEAGRDGTAMPSDRLVLVALADGRAERIQIREGQHVPTGAHLLSLRMEAPPFVQAWLSTDYVGRVWVGRPAQVRFPDGSRREAVITQVMASTEMLPEGLAGTSRAGRSSLVIRLQLQGAVLSQINFLPVEVRLRWRDDLTRWMETLRGRPAE